MQEVFTKEQLMVRWQCSDSLIKKLVSEGKLNPCPGFTKFIFRAEEVDMLEGRQYDPLSAFERKRLESRVEALEKEVQQLKTRNAQCVNILMGVTAS